MEPMVLMEGMTNEEALGKEVTVDPKDYVNVDGYTEAQIAQMDLPQWENKEGYYDVIGEDGRYIYMSALLGGFVRWFYVIMYNGRSRKHWSGERAQYRPHQQGLS